MKLLKILIASIGAAASHTMAGGPPLEPSWSKIVRGLQARLIVSSEKTSAEWPFLQTYLELKNRSSKPIEIRLDPEKIVFTVEKDGKALTRDMGNPYNKLTAPVAVRVVPAHDTIKIDITSHAAGPQAGKYSLDLGIDQYWFLPAKNLDAFFLKGKVVVARSRADDDKLWFGTLDIPKTPIPLGGE